MKSNIELLNSKQHKTLKFDMAKNGADAHKERQMTIVYAAEFPSIAASYPIVFVKLPDTGEFKAVALFGLQREKNVLVANGKWQSFTLPIVMRAYPFIFVPTNEEKTSYSIAADLASESLNEESGELLFDESGEPGTTLQQVQEMLGDAVEHEARTTVFIDALVEHDLLEAKSLDAKLDGVNSTRVDGFYMINDKKLRELDPEITHKWLQNGYLDIIFAHLQSQQQVMNLIKHHQIQQDT